MIVVITELVLCGNAKFAALSFLLCFVNWYWCELNVHLINFAIHTQTCTITRTYINIKQWNIYKLYFTRYRNFFSVYMSLSNMLQKVWHELRNVRVLICNPAWNLKMYLILHFIYFKKVLKYFLNKIYLETYCAS